MPAPLSPLTTIDWLVACGSSSARYADSATAYGWGATTESDGAARTVSISGCATGCSGLTATSRCATYVYGSSRSKRPRRLCSTPGSWRCHSEVMSASSDGLHVSSSPPAAAMSTVTVVPLAVSTLSLIEGGRVTVRETRECALAGGALVGRRAAACGMAIARGDCIAYVEFPTCASTFPAIHESTGSLIHTSSAPCVIALGVRDAAREGTKGSTTRSNVPRLAAKGYFPTQESDGG